MGISIAFQSPQNTFLGLVNQQCTTVLYVCYLRSMFHIFSFSVKICLSQKRKNIFDSILEMTENSIKIAIQKNQMNKNSFSQHERDLLYNVFFSLANEYQEVRGRDRAIPHKFKFQTKKEFSLRIPKKGPLQKVSEM